MGIIVYILLSTLPITLPILIIGIYKGLILEAIVAAFLFQIIVALPILVLIMYLCYRDGTGWLD